MTLIDCIIATNDAGVVYPGHLNHWVTLHPEKMPAWWDQRLRHRLEPPDKVWFHRESSEFILPHEVLPDWGGSSGLLATQVALKLGSKKIVLCGVPMESTQHFFSERKLLGVTRYREGWVNYLSELTERVRSMSGWTAQLLGEPDDVWLKTQGENADGAQSST